MVINLLKCWRRNEPSPFSAHSRYTIPKRAIGLMPAFLDGSATRFPATFWHRRVYKSLW